MKGTFLSSIVWEAFGIKCRWLNWTEFHCFISFHSIKARLKENNLNREYIPFLILAQLKKHMSIFKLCTLIHRYQMNLILFFLFSLGVQRDRVSRFFVEMSEETCGFITFSCFREGIQIITPWAWWIWWNRVI